MEAFLYDKTLTCPVCSREFISKKVRSTRLKVLERQDDLNVVYQGVNPLYYQIFVCPHCGFSAIESAMQEVTVLEKRAFDDHIRYKWKERDYGGVRTAEDAEICYKLAILVAQTTNKPISYMANLSLKLAWLYRSMGSPQEETYLRYALEQFESVYQTQRLEGAGIDEVTICYLIGELHRHFGDYREAIVWYGKVLDNPDTKHNRQLQLKTREQWKRAKEQYDEARARRDAQQA